MKKYILSLVSILLFTSCDDLFSPAVENQKDLSTIYTDPTYAQGFLITAYSKIPGYYDNSEYATDDAVTNQKNNVFLKAATGTWTSESNPFNRWTDSYNAILYLNIFLANADDITFATNGEVNALTCMRMKGEAHTLRALHMFYLLRSHAGYIDDGRLMGVQIIKDILDSEADFNIERSTFEECIQYIYSDLDEADNFLPMEYDDIASDSNIPEKFRIITTNKDFYNRVMGRVARQLCNGLIAKAIRTKVALLAASPAFQDASNTTTWEYAANAAAEVVDYAGGVGGLDPNGHIYYTDVAAIGAISEASNPKDIIWRDNLQINNSAEEEQNYPPSLFGKGFMNPTQNLVDAFPMANGYPINNSNSLYNSSNPYADRDPRLAHYIIYNGSSAGPAGRIIMTGSASGTDDGINRLETSTRTGYYMKKRLIMKVNRNPASITGQTHYMPRIRYTEIYLNYAECANEAWGPDGKGSHSYSAYDIIKAIRKRAGVGVSNNDPYLEECKADKTKMQKLIRNERRLELSFESFRFWDIRRWKLNLAVPACGMDINQDVYTPLNDIEERAYKDYMYYGPIPYPEILKYDNLLQNKGW